MKWKIRKAETKCSRDKNMEVRLREMENKVRIIEIPGRNLGMAYFRY